MKKTLYKTVISFEVLSEEPIPNSLSIGDIQEEAMDGSYSMITGTQKVTKVIGKRAVNECKKHGTDTEFFCMNSEGNDNDF